MSDPALTHVDGHGDVQMVDVSAKSETQRTAAARAVVRGDAAALAAIRNDSPKGNVLATARIAGIQAAKQTAALIPLCHPLPLTHVDVDVRVDQTEVVIDTTATCVGRTGVEMEALTAAAVAALTVIDMVKAVDRWMTIESVGLVSKSGGKSGTLQRPESRPLR